MSGIITKGSLYMRILALGASNGVNNKTNKQVFKSAAEREAFSFITEESIHNGRSLNDTFELLKNIFIKTYKDNKVDSNSFAFLTPKNGGSVKINYDAKKGLSYFDMSKNPHKESLIRYSETKPGVIEKSIENSEVENLNKHIEKDLFIMKKGDDDFVQVPNKLSRITVKAR